MNALKSLANPTPVRSLVVVYYTRFTTENFKHQKKQEIKTELQVRAEHGARHNAAWIGPANSAKVQNRIVFFSERSNDDTLLGLQPHSATSDCTRALDGPHRICGCGLIGLWNSARLYRS
jgi:hypothetical protein